MKGKASPARAVAVALGGLLLAAASPSPPAKFTAVTVAGETIGSDTTRGKVVILTWWARWCAPCKGELQDFETLYRRHRRSGLEIVALDADMNKARYRFRAPAAVTSFPFARSFQGRAFALRGVPTTYVIGRDGRLRRAYHRRLTLHEMEQALDGLL